jgi:hypothetical protein
MLNGLTNSTRYYIRVHGVTVNGLRVDTGFISFLVEYEVLGLFSVLRLENRECESSVRISSRIVLISGKYGCEPDEPTYIDDNAVDLHNGCSVIFDEGFRLDGDFLIQFKGWGFLRNETILILDDTQSVIQLIWRHGNWHNGDGATSPHSYIDLISTTSPHYVLHSNYLTDLSDTDMVHVWLRRVNGLYEIKIANA